MTAHVVGIPLSVLGAVLTSFGYARWRRVYLLRTAARSQVTKGAITRGYAVALVLVGWGIQGLSLAWVSHVFAISVTALCVLVNVATAMSNIPWIGLNEQLPMPANGGGTSPLYLFFGLASMCVTFTAVGSAMQETDDLVTISPLNSACFAFVVVYANSVVTALLQRFDERLFVSEHLKDSAVLLDDAAASGTEFELSNRDDLDAPIAPDGVVEASAPAEGLAVSFGNSFFFSRRSEFASVVAAGWSTLVYASADLVAKKTRAHFWDCETPAQALRNFMSRLPHSGGANQTHPEGVTRDAVNVTAGDGLLYSKLDFDGMVCNWTSRIQNDADIAIAVIVCVACLLMSMHALDTALSGQQGNVIVLPLMNMCQAVLAAVWTFVSFRNGDAEVVMTKLKVLMWILGGICCVLATSCACWNDAARSYVQLDCELEEYGDDQRNGKRGGNEGSLQESGADFAQWVSATIRSGVRTNYDCVHSACEEDLDNGFAETDPEEEQGEEQEALAMQPASAHVAVRSEEEEEADEERAEELMAPVRVDVCDSASEGDGLIADQE